MAPHPQRPRRDSIRSCRSGRGDGQTPDRSAPMATDHGHGPDGPSGRPALAVVGHRLCRHQTTAARSALPGSVAGGRLEGIP
jgi:hypothetical protein